VDSFECLWEPFVVFGESAEAGCPGEAAFYHSSAGQQHEASFGHGVLDHFEPDAVLLSGFGCVGTGVALVDIGQFDRIARKLLHVPGE